MPDAAPADSTRTIQIVKRGLKRRYRAERRFRLYGFAGDRGQHPLSRRPARHHFDPGLLGLLAARGPPGRVLRPRGPETGHPRQRRLPRARSRRPPEALPGGREPPGPQAAHGADQLRGRLPVARHGAARPRRHRADGPGPGPARRRDRHAAQGRLPARRAGSGAARFGPADRVARRAGLRGSCRAALQHRVSDVRGLARTRARGHPRGSDGVVLGAAGDAGAVLPDRGRGRGLPRRVRPAQPLDGHHRGQHQQPGGGALDRVRAARARGFPERLRTAAFGAGRRRPGADAS